MVNAYRINKTFSVGAGIGYEYLDGLYYSTYEYSSGTGSSYYDSSNDVRNMVKLYGRFKVNLAAAKVSPFLSVDLGTSIGIGSNEIKMANGFYFEPCFGCDIDINEKQVIYLMLGYNGQGYDYKAFDTTLGDSEDEIRHIVAGKFSVHIGFKF